MLFKQLDTDSMYGTFPHSNLDKNKTILYLNKLYEDLTHQQKPPDELLKELATLPDIVLVYFFVEISKMIKEKNCFPFEKREPGCLSAYFQGLAKVFENMDDLTISHKLIKDLHATNTDPSKVTNTELKSEKSGNYRIDDSDNEYLIIPFNDLSPAGLKMLIDFIENEEIGNFFIKGTNKEIENLENRKNTFEKLYDFILWLQDYESSDNPMFDDNIIQQFNELTKDSKLDNTINDDKAKILLVIKNIADMLEISIKDINPNSIDYQQTITETNSVINNFRSDDINTIFNTLKDPTTMEIISIHLNTASMLFFSIDDFLLKKKDILNFKKDQSTDSNDVIADNYFKKLKENNLNLMLNFTNKNIHSLMNDLINEVNEKLPAMKNATIEDKLKFVANFTQKSLLIHPFVDANNRTIANQIALWIMIQLELPPMVFFNPFVFYGHDQSELVDIFKLSIANYLAVLDCAKHGNQYFDGFTENLSKEQIDEVSAFVKPFRDFLSSKYPDIKPASLERFEKQSNVINEHSVFTKKSESITSLNSDKKPDTGPLI